MIEVDNLWKSFGKAEVLKGLSLKVDKGETLVILGRSGVGKSVLLKHIIGIDQCDKGTIKINGLDVTSLRGEEKYEATRDIGMLFQGAALFDSLNIEENTGFYLNQHRRLTGSKLITHSEIQDRVNEALKMVDLDGSQKKMPSDLSGGMRKRAGLARLIVYRPKLLLYDEPTTGLDPITALQINELIVKTQKELKATSIVVTHDIVSALFVADRLALHKDGKIAYVDTIDNFLNIDDPIINFMKNSMAQDPRSLRRKSFD